MCFSRLSVVLALAAAITSCDSETESTMTSVSADSATSAVATASPCMPPKAMFKVNGSDSRGSFTGFVAFKGGALPRFVRHVDFGESLKTADGRRVAWLWTGTTQSISYPNVALATSLKVRDFIASAGAVKRVPGDPATLAVSSVATFGEGCVATVKHTISGGDIVNETWTPHADANLASTFAGEDRSLAYTTPALSSAQRAVLFTAFASFHDLEMIRPYRERPAFREGRSAEIIDKTDYAYYRKNRGVVRVVGKVLDEVSIAETMPRATAFAKPIASKASEADLAMETKFIDPVTKCVVAGVIGDGVRAPSGDGALWQGMYLVSQIERFKLTGSAKARANVIAALECILLLQEIVPDKTTFARTLRAAQPNAAAPWHRGTGAYSHIDWLSGGNNDMVKGVLLSLARSFTFLCKPEVTDAARCARITANARALADRVEVSSRPGNFLLSNWLAAYVTSGFTSLKYASKAAAAFAITTPVQDVLAGLSTYYGIVDWSGVHLNFATYLVQLHLAEVKSLPGLSNADLLSRVHGTMKTFAGRFAPFRNAVWTLYGAKHAGCKACAADALWRMREFPIPKVNVDVDHRLSPTFEMSPFPSLPWKNDWLTTDRAISLHGYPLFETGIDEYAWKNSNHEYREVTLGADIAVTDYVFAYWFGRSLGVLPAAD